MDHFVDCSELTIDKHLSSFHSKDFSIYNERGQLTASAESADQSTFQKFKAFLFDHFRKREVNVLNNAKNPLFLCKCGTFWYPKIWVQTAEGKPIGMIRKQCRFIYTTFYIYDYRQILFAKLTFPIWAHKSMKVLSRGNKEIGTIKHDGPFMSSMYKRYINSYTLKFKEHAFQPYQKSLILMALIMMDVQLMDRVKNHS